MAAQIGTDAALLAGIDDEFGAVEPRPDAEALEREQSGPKVVAADAVDRDRTARDGRESDERADLDVIRADGVGRGRRRERRATLDREGVGADAIDGGAEGHEKAREVLDVRLRRSVAQDGGAGCPHRGHQGVDFRLGQLRGHETRFRAVVAEDVAEARRDHGPEAVVH